MSFFAFLKEWDECKQAVVAEHGGSLTEATTVKLTKELARAVYHRDYLTTKDKPYRKYNRARRKKTAVKSS